MLDIILSFLWAFLIAIFAVPSIIDVSHRKKLFDTPNHRTVHMMLTPRLGGLAIFAGMMSGVTIFGEITNGVQQLLAGCLIIFFIGVKDDVVTVSVVKKFFVQVLGAGIIMFIGDVRISSFQGLFGIYDLDIGLSYAFTFLAIIGITNAINLIDGLDGLAGSIVFIISVTFGIFFFDPLPSYAFVAFSLAGATLGFLRYNFHKATIFMGDTGSLVCGFIVSIMAIQFIEMQSVEASPGIALGILVLPIFDTLRVFSIRILNGRSPFYPDKNHIHHRLVAMNMSHLQAVCTLIVFNIFVIIIVVSFAYYGTLSLIIGLLVLALVLNILLSVLGKKNFHDKSAA